MLCIIKPNSTKTKYTEQVEKIKKHNDKELETIKEEGAEQIENIQNNINNNTSIDNEIFIS